MNINSETWCPIPFIGLSIHPRGFISRCMMSDMKMSDNDWDCDSLQQLRQDMLNGIWDKSFCKSCFTKESMGMTSQRRNWLEKHAKHYPADAYNNPKISGNVIRHLFINFNNICNFKCRMCNPKFSSSLLPEFKKLSDNKLLKNIGYLKDIHHYSSNITNEILERYKEQLNDVVTIWVTGGEPFINNNIWDTLEILNEYANPNKIVMNITTNGSLIKVDDLQRFEHFKHIAIDLSIDSIGKMFEYMRSSGKFSWNEIDTLIDDLIIFKKENKWFNLVLNSSFQLLNVCDVRKFYDYIYSKFGESHTNMRILTTPSYMRACHAPSLTKHRARQEIYKTLKFNWLTDKDKQILNDCLTELDNNQNIDEFIKFKKANSFRDRYRDMFLKEYDNELAKEIFNEEIN